MRLHGYARLCACAAVASSPLLRSPPPPHTCNCATGRLFPAHQMHKWLSYGNGELLLMMMMVMVLSLTSKPAADDDADPHQSEKPRSSPHVDCPAQTTQHATLTPRSPCTTRHTAPENQRQTLACQAQTPRSAPGARCASPWRATSLRATSPSRCAAELRGLWG